MTRWAAATFVAVYFGLVVIVTTAAGIDRADSPRRVIGEGQIKFDGAGPERWAMRYRRERRTADRLRALLSVHLERIVGLVMAFDCVHAGEGSWTANTGNGFFGGLQFDLGSWVANGGRRFASRADLATPAQQMTVAITYHARAGFYPWPNTARRCGLIR